MGEGFRLGSQVDPVAGIPYIGTMIRLQPGRDGNVFAGACLVGNRVVEAFFDAQPLSQLDVPGCADDWVILT